MKLEPAITSYLRGVLRDIAQNLLNLQQVSMPADQLFRALMPDERTYHVMKAAAELRTPTSIDTERELIVGNAPIGFTLTLPLGFWLFPAFLATITPESELGRKLKLILTTAQDLASLHYVFEQVLDHAPYSNVVSNMFPWVKDLMRDIPRGPDNQYKFERFVRWDLNLGSSSRNVERVRNQLDALETGKGNNSPLTITPDLNRACRSGGQAISQYHMVKGTKLPARSDDDGHLTPTLRLSIPKSIREQMDLAVHHYKTKYREIE